MTRGTQERERKERRETGKEGYKKAGCQKGGIQERRDTSKKYSGKE